jgi:hypothetical protein
MNDLYEETILRRGKVYHYDPDRDIYYPHPQPLSTFDRWAWIVTSVVLLAAVLYLEFLR